jgi:hypothetical protein
MLQNRLSIVVSLCALTVLLFGFSGSAHAQLPRIGKSCTQCHTAENNVIRGKLANLSEKFKTMQIIAGTFAWVVTYDDRTSVTNAKAINAIKKGKEVAVNFTGTDKNPRALSVSVKPPYKLPKEKQMSIEEIASLVAKGPEKGKYFLFDARPKPRYLEGHMPTAVSLPYHAFDKLQASVLPKDKDALIIFYCGGVT